MSSWQEAALWEPANEFVMEELARSIRRELAH